MQAETSLISTAMCSPGCARRSWFSVLDRKYLKRLLPWAVILPLLWMGTFTWA